MSHSTDEMRTRDGLRLFTQSWTIDNPIAELFLIHGMSEHSSRYQWTAASFNKEKINVYSLDYRGHGKSEGERSFCNSFDEFVEDVHEYIESKKSDRGFFMLGHSMGGLITVSYLTKYPTSTCKGVILSAPLLKPGADTPPILIKLSPIISALLPRLKAVKLDPNNISRDQDVVKDYINDPLVYMKGIKARLGSEMMKYMNYVRENFSSFKYPVLLMHGTGDKLVDHEGSQWMYDEIVSKDKTLKLLPGLYHQILDEPEKEEVITEMTNWIRERSMPGEI